MALYMYTVDSQVIHSRLDLKETVEQHEKSQTRETDEPRDFIDAYLEEIRQQSKKNPSTTFTCKFFTLYLT